MAELLVHIGLHKTGTSYLQRRVFPNIPGIDYRGDPLTVEALAELRDVETSAGAWPLANDPGQRPVLVSWEGLSADLWHDPVGSRERVAERIGRLEPNAHILLCLRRQDQMLRAVYAQFVNEGGAEGPGMFVRRAAEGAHFDLRHLQYDDLVERYAERFQDRLHVMVYEDFKERGLAALDEALVPSLGVRAPSVVGGAEPLNLSLDGHALRLLLLTNRYFRRSALNPEPMMSIAGASRMRGWLQNRGQRLSHAGARIDLWASVPSDQRSEIVDSNQRLALVVPAIRRHGYLSL
jgi:hypothetical protein